jgi:hypothetical protein
MSETMRDIGVIKTGMGAAVIAKGVGMSAMKFGGGTLNSG